MGLKKKFTLRKSNNLFFLEEYTNSLILTNMLSGIWPTNNITSICVKWANVSIPETVDSKKQKLDFKFITSYIFTVWLLVWWLLKYYTILHYSILILCYTTLINGNYVKTKISHNSENLKPSWDIVHFFPFSHKALTCLT